MILLLSGILGLSFVTFVVDIVFMILYQMEGQVAWEVYGTYVLFNAIPLLWISCDLCPKPVGEAEANRYEMKTTPSTLPLNRQSSFSPSIVENTVSNSQASSLTDSPQEIV